MSRVKIVVTVPINEADALRQAIGKAGGGQVGEYSFCSFSVRGTGRFVPGEHAHPAIGSAHEPELVEEERIEITCLHKDAAKIVQAIKFAHSYEEPAIDVYALIDV